MPNISEAKILMIATDGYEDSELLEPRRILSERGADVTLASLEKGEIAGDNGASVEVDRTIDEVDERDYDALILPGGTKNPDKLRMDDRVVATIRAFAEAGKPVAAICHGPWLLVEADVIRGRRVTRLAVDPNRPAQRRCRSRRRGSGHRRQYRHQPQAGGHPRLHRGCDRFVRKGRGAARNRLRLWIVRRRGSCPAKAGIQPHRPRRRAPAFAGERRHSAAESTGRRARRRSKSRFSARCAGRSTP